MKCRACGNEDFTPFADLQNCPPSNSMLTKASLTQPEAYYPLNVEVCNHCFLVQVDEHKRAVEIFTGEYTYFSSISRSWLAHCERYADYAIGRFGLTERSRVVEIASNDGYLLQYFKRAGIPVLGIEPTANTAEQAMGRGIPTIVEFFGRDFARERLRERGLLADLIVANNVLAHVPDIRDFSAGLKIALAPTGTITLEFPHLLRLVEEAQFDTIYHEHFSYLSLSTVRAIFASEGLKVVDVEQLPTHGGSLRVFATHAENGQSLSPAVADLLEEEQRCGLLDPAFYAGFQARIDDIRADFLQFLLDQRRQRKKVAGYGAAAKGNTLLNYCGIKGNELIRFVSDLSPFKQGKLLPGSHIPVLPPSAIDETKPDFIIIFPWNIKEEVMAQLAHARDWGARFVTAIPTLSID
jgi:2-polyprenyl-3-methyl-5-hydroxy-6-metoxy-1,4-benzoquinol methylase